MSQRSDLQELLNEQIGFLERSCLSYDQGFIDEAKRIAVTIRVLLHDTSQSHSLFQQLGYQDYLLIDTCPELEEAPPDRIFQAGLAVPSLNGYVPRHQLPSKTEAPLWQRFKYWWTSAVIKTPDRTYSRRDLVLLLANREGGAHVDPKLTAHYEKLKRQGSGFFSFEEGREPEPMTKEEHACLRQIAYEVLETLGAVLHGEAPKDDHDERATAFRFPVYIFLKAENDTPLHEIGIATIGSLDNLLPVFDSESEAEKAKAVLVGDYEAKPLGKNGFVSFLRKVALPRGIEYLTINPDLASHERRMIHRTSVMNMVSSLEAEYADEEVEQKLESGEFKRA